MSVWMISERFARFLCVFSIPVLNGKWEVGTCAGASRDVIIGRHKNDHTTHRSTIVPVLVISHEGSNYLNMKQEFWCSKSVLTIYKPGACGKRGLGGANTGGCREGIERAAQNSILA